MLIEFLLVLGALALLFWRWDRNSFKVFKERSVPYEEPSFLVGNTKGMWKSEYSFFRKLIEFYERNKHHKVVGYYHMRDPFFIVNDPELLKKICIKDFDVFRNHYPMIPTVNEPLWERMVLNLEDQAWKEMRTYLTPAFTANKMRTMFTLMEECFDESLKYLKNLSTDGQPIEIEMKDCFARLSNDIIASTAFGLKINSYENRNNEFYSIGQNLTNFRGSQTLKLLVNVLAPWLTRLLGIKIFDPKKCEYFTRLVLDTIQYRKENNIVRPDMIQLLIEAQKESGKDWSEVDVVAQCFVFFFAAFENNSNLISLSGYELMTNPDKQQRLYEEVLAVHEELKGAPVTYDVVNKMEYMDMVVNEVLRLWNFSMITNRYCSEDYELTDDEGNLVCNLKKGDVIWIPLLPLSLDERFFEEPRKFKPERFSPENKDKIKPFTNIPFGAGRRSCIGNRYALMQGKAMLYHLILNYKLEKGEKSVDSLYDSIKGFILMPKDGIWIRLVPRKNQQ